MQCKYYFYVNFGDQIKKKLFAASFCKEEYWTPPQKFHTKKTINLNLKNLNLQYLKFNLFSSVIFLIELIYIKIIYLVII